MLTTVFDRISYRIPVSANPIRNFTKRNVSRLFQIKPRDEMTEPSPSLTAEELAMAAKRKKDADAVVAKWLTKFDAQQLHESDIRDYWKFWVTRIYQPEKCDGEIRWTTYKNELTGSLYNVLEGFMLGDADARVLYGHPNGLPSKCGRMFVAGECTFHCLDCETRSVSVMCTRCFIDSPHKNHEYRLGSSSGGGCCDCGDENAWYQYPRCAEHELGVPPKDDDDDGNAYRMPADVQERCRLIIRAVLRYAHELLAGAGHGEPTTTLPGDLRRDPEPDACGVVLYDNYSNSFGEVLVTLKRFLKCTDQEYNDVASTIDRDGRVVVLCDTRDKCDQFFKEVDVYLLIKGEGKSRPLIPQVIHADLIAHQSCALQLLSWAKNLMRRSEGLRAVFSDLVLVGSDLTPAGGCLVESILHADHVLWKWGRAEWLKIFITGTFTEPEPKQRFAAVYVNNYVAIVEDFMGRVNKRTCSVLSLGIQLFTDSTLACHLVARHDLLLKQFSMLATVFADHTDPQGQMVVPAAEVLYPFKKAQYIFQDIGYVLERAPDVWNEELRVSFCHAVREMLGLLGRVENAHAVARQTGQHVAYEPEWETAFGVLLKLRPAIRNMWSWCGSDGAVLRQAYKMTAKKLCENPAAGPSRPYATRELAGHWASCIDFDVSAEPVSIHHPLFRFLAGLHLHLERYGIDMERDEELTDRPTPEQLIEPALRTSALVAQVRVGMWSRNGFSMQNLMHLYGSFKFSFEMHDMDVVLLQIGASSMDSDEFLIHLLNRFGLMKWARPDYEPPNASGEADDYDDGQEEDDAGDRTVRMAEEFLGLVIAIVSERYTPGVGQVTTVDCIKYQAIQRLCVRPQPYSLLSRMVVKHSANKRCLDRVLNEIAMLNKSNGKGANYELKPEYLDHCNEFFYHYSKEDASILEGKRKQSGKTTAAGLGFGRPRDLPPFAGSFSRVVDLLQCDVMLHVIKLILNRTADPECKSFSEPQVHRILYLVGYALLEEEKRRSPKFAFAELSRAYGVENALANLRRNPRIEAYRDLAAWTVNKFGEVTGPGGKRTKIAEDAGDASADEARARNAKMAAERRAAVMAQMERMQKNFMTKNAATFETTPAGGADAPDNGDAASATVSRTTVGFPVALGPRKTSGNCPVREVTCILCQAPQYVHHSNPPLVLLAFVQRSTVLSHVRREPKCRNHDFPPNPYYINTSFCTSPHVSSCGHAMHLSCWQKHFQMTEDNEDRRRYRLRLSVPFDITLGEYLCPLCERLCNVVVPLLPAISSFDETAGTAVRFANVTFNTWLVGLDIALQRCKAVDPRCPDKSWNDHERRAIDRGPGNNQPAPGCVGGEQEQNGEPPEERNEGDDDGDGGDENGEGDDADDSDADDGSDATTETDGTDEDFEDDADVQFPHCQFSVGPSHFVRQQIVYDGLNQPTSVAKRPVSTGRTLSDDLAKPCATFANNTASTGFPYRVPDYMTPLITWRACAYTIQMDEVILRFANKPLFGGLTTRQSECLEALVRVSAVLGSTNRDDTDICLHAFRMVSMAIDNSGNNEIGILDWDTFSMLVSMTMALPSLYHSEVPIPIARETVFDHHLLQLMFVTHLVQIISTYDIEIDPDEVVAEETDADRARDAHLVAELIHRLRGVRVRNAAAALDLVWSFAVPFLRSCSLFYHYLTGVPPPVALTELDGCTYQNMCRFLALPFTFHELMDRPEIETLINRWTADQKLVRIAMGGLMHFRQWVQIQGLLHLPDHYSRILATVSEYYCPTSTHQDLRNPAMCLVCGDLICSENFCCQITLKGDVRVSKNVFIIGKKK